MKAVCWFYTAGQKAARSVKEVAVSERAAATAEYALLLALVVIVLITTLTELGSAINGRIEDITDQLSRP